MATSAKNAAATPTTEKPQETGVPEADELNAPVQEAVDEETRKGYRGANTDPTPDEHYTVAGVAKGLPTPETHPEQAAKVGSAKFQTGGVVSE